MLLTVIALAATTSLATSRLAATDVQLEVADALGQPVPGVTVRLYAPTIDKDIALGEYVSGETGLIMASIQKPPEEVRFFVPEQEHAMPFFPKDDALNLENGQRRIVLQRDFTSADMEALRTLEGPALKKKVLDLIVSSREALAWEILAHIYTDRGPFREALQQLTKDPAYGHLATAFLRAHYPHTGAIATANARFFSLRDGSQVEISWDFWDCCGVHKSRKITLQRMPGSTFLAARIQEGGFLGTADPESGESYLLTFPDLRTWMGAMGMYQNTGPAKSRDAWKLQFRRLPPDGVDAKPDAEIPTHVFENPIGGPEFLAGFLRACEANGKLPTGG